MSSLHTRSLSSASFIGTNIDLLSLILICLPIKSIFAVILVSKLWRSVILDSSFQQSLKEKCKHMYSVMLIRRSFCLRNRFREFEYNFLDKDVSSSIPFETLGFGSSTQGIQIDQCCNGLLLCSCEISTNSWGRAYYVYNPCTEQYKLISHHSRGFCSDALVSLAFDPSKSPFYKVVSLWGTGGRYQIEIYSSQSSSLKICRENFRIFVRMPSSSGIYWNRSLHWMSPQGTLMYFEVDEEVIKHLMVMPYRIDGRIKKILYFDVCRGHLQTVVQDSAGAGSLFDVMEMNTAYTGWNIKYRLDLETGMRDSYPLLVGDRLKCKVMIYDEVDADGKGSPKLLLVIDSPILHVVISYDVNDMQFKRIQNLEQPCVSPGECRMLSLRLHHYTGSLARA